MGGNLPKIITIIHKIMNRIPPARHRAQPTTILETRTTLRAQALLVGIINKIPRIAHAAGVSLEGMQEPHPMPDLVHGRAPEIVALGAEILGGLAGEGAGEDVAAVGAVDGGGEGDGGAGGAGGVGVGDGGGEGAVAEEGGAGGVWGGRGRAEVGLEVEVEGGIGALAEGCFHRGGGGAVEGPGVVDGVGGGVAEEGDVGGGEGLVEDGGLGGWDVRVGIGLEVKEEKKRGRCGEGRMT